MPGRPRGHVQTPILDKETLKKAHRYVLFNSNNDVVAHLAM